MRIVFLAQRVPYPPDRGDKIPAFNEVRHLARHHDVHVFCLADGKEDLANLEGLSAIVASAAAVPLRRLAARLRVLWSLATGRSLTVGHFNERELHRRLARHMSERGADLLLVFSSGMAQFAEPYATVPRIMQFVDLDSLKWAQLARTSAAPMRWIYAIEARRLLRYERKVARDFSHSIVCTPSELADFHRLVQQERVSCVANGVDLEFFSPGPEPKRPGSMVFTGVMDYAPNIDAMLWFCREILPLIRRQVPEATLTICGSRPVRAVLDLAALDGVTVTGRVPEVVPYLRQAEVAVVPMRLGRGVQNKLLEAMATGLPCVATERAFGGIKAQANHDLLVADSPDLFASAVVALLRDSEERHRLGARARMAMETNYRWPTQLRRLDEIIAQVAVEA